MTKFPAGSNGTALYYPYLSISDKSWLLGSLCFWESVRRIVPAGLRITDPDWLASLEGKALVTRAETEYPLEMARTQFLAAITPVGAAEAASGVDAKELLRARFEALKDGPSETIEIHYAKGDTRLWPLLVEAGLAVWGDGGFVRVGRSVGELYMTCLATAMSESSDSPLITDQARYVDWSRKLASVPSQAIAAGEPMLAEVASLDLDWPDTGAFAEITPSRFVKFHKDSSAARSTFRSFLLRMREGRARAQSREQDVDIVRQFKIDLKAAHDEILAKVNELGVKKRGGVLSLIASATRPWLIPDRLLAIGRDNAERRTALSQMYKNPAYYTYLVKKNWP